MFRYVATAAAALLVLAVALKARQADSPGPEALEVESQDAPEVTVVERGDELLVTVRHRLAGSLSRAALVHELDGRERTVAQQTDCQRSLAAGSESEDDGYASQVDLSGSVPRGTTSLRLVLEDETGTRILPVHLN